MLQTHQVGYLWYLFLKKTYDRVWYPTWYQYIQPAKRSNLQQTASLSFQVHPSPEPVFRHFNFIILFDYLIFFLFFFLLYMNSFLLFARKEDGYERLFTSKFSVETTQGDRECLESTKRIIEIHGEYIIGNSSKLHHNVVLYKKQNGKRNILRKGYHWDKRNMQNNKIDIWIYYNVNLIHSVTTY